MVTFGTDNQSDFDFHAGFIAYFKKFIFLLGSERRVLGFRNAIPEVDY